MDEYIDRLELYSQSNHEIAADIGRRFHDYRVALRLTQKDISEATGISVMTLVRFENGGADSLRLGSFLALLRAVQKLENIQGLIPDMPVSLYESRAKEAPVRVRRRKNEK